ncbi:MAG TPA: carotenoid biosynthesis protein [Deltaproteobacteria bacterium]|nr:carotenoid biosynthesis protein [Deltaproteobacteria bacterium]
MTDFLHTLAYTAAKRWYVVVFLLSYLGIASFHWGWKRTLKLLVLGYFIAWASEASSIRNGFPYGDYTYRYESMAGEIFLAGVPVWDSLSYVFLSFSGYMAALFLRSRWHRYTPLQELQSSWKTVLGGALLTMILDMVIDPVANQGEKWFLGDIYFYPHGGLYFGVPLSNFAGWFLTALAILAAFRLSDSLKGVPRHPASMGLGTALYLGIYFFNLGITLYIQEYSLAAAAAGWGLLFVWLARKGRRANPSFL